MFGNFWFHPIMKNNQKKKNKKKIGFNKKKVVSL